jgi:hypothetical protein
MTQFRDLAIGDQFYRDVLGHLYGPYTKCDFGAYHHNDGGLGVSGISPRSDVVLPQDAPTAPVSDDPTEADPQGHPPVMITFMDNQGDWDSYIVRAPGDCLDGVDRSAYEAFLAVNNPSPDAYVKMGKVYVEWAK